jgi:hypothetical protein
MERENVVNPLRNMLVCDNITEKGAGILYDKAIEARRTVHKEQDPDDRYRTREGLTPYTPNRHVERSIQYV